LVTENAKLGRPSTFKKGLRHQDHAKMNAHILGNVMAVQRRNDQKVVSHVHVKTQRKWDKLITIPFDLHQTCMKSCARLNVSIWLLAHLAIPFFCLLSIFFSIALRTKFDLSHPLVLGVSDCICSQPLDLMEIHFFHCTHGGERTILHDIV
jgi:hypothetical protein